MAGGMRPPAARLGRFPVRTMARLKVPGCYHRRAHSKRLDECSWL